MTKTEANNLKDIIKKLYPKRRLVYSSIKEELRVWVYSYKLEGNEKPYNELEERTEILKLLNTISENGHRPKYRIERKRDMGCGKHTYICFK